MSKVGLPELTNLLETSDASPYAIPEQLAAWDIDPDMWLKWAGAITDSTIEEYAENRETRFCMLLQFWMGFELGYRLAVESELDRMANSE